MLACLAVPVCGSESDAPTVQISNAVIASREGERLRVVFAAEGQPAVLFKPAGTAWDWRRTSKLVIPVENPGGEAATLLLRVSDDADRSSSGKASIAPGSAGDLTLWIDTPSPRQMGMIGGPSLMAAGLEAHTLPVTATEGSVDASRVTWSAWGSHGRRPLREMVIGPLRVMPPGRGREHGL